MIDRLVELFVVEVRYGRSIDWYLVKLSGIVSSINDMCRGGACDPRELFKEFLSNEKVRKALATLACYRGEVLETIRSNPRFRNLRGYIDLIDNTLSSIECVSGERLEYVPRPATWVIEAREREVLRPREARIEKPIIRRVSVFRETGVERLVTIVSIALLIIVIVIVILKFVLGVI